MILFERSTVSPIKKTMAACYYISLNYCNLLDRISKLANPIKTIPMHFIYFIFMVLCLITVAFAESDLRPDINATELERHVHQQINRERQRYGLPNLHNNTSLTVIARHHSQDMASHQFFSHINPQGESPTDRGLRQHWQVNKQLDSQTQLTGIAENLFLTHLYDKVITTTENGFTIKKDYQWNSLEQIAKTIVQGWMNSPGHRENLLSPRYDQQGIGIAISGNDVFVTEDLF